MAEIKNTGPRRSGYLLWARCGHSGPSQLRRCSMPRDVILMNLRGLAVGLKSLSTRLNGCNMPAHIGILSTLVPTNEMCSLTSPDAGTHR